MQTLKVNEIFFSIQGEGSHSGLPCIFIRLTGCQMRCSYCDTEYAFYDGRLMNLGQVLDQIRTYPCRLVEITGGEPLLQKAAVIPLMQALREQNYEVMIETGGGFPLHTLPASVIKILDVKCPDSGETKNMDWSFLKERIPNTQLKFVLSSDGDYFWAKDWLRDHPQVKDWYPVYFSPVSKRYSPKNLAESILRDGLPVRMQVQLHKTIWGEHAAGV